MSEFGHLQACRAAGFPTAMIFMSVAWMVAEAAVASVPASYRVLMRRTFLCLQVYASVFLMSPGLYFDRILHIKPLSAVPSLL